MGTFTLLVALLSALTALMPTAAPHPSSASANLTPSVAAAVATTDAQSGGAASRSKMALGVSMLPYNDLSVLDNFTASVGGASHRPAIWSVWSDWLGLNRAFPKNMMQGLSERGVTPMVFWSPDNPTRQNSGEITYKKILDGDFDSYIRRWALDAKAWGHPVVVRWAHEMDGNWFPWSVGRFGSTPAQFVAAWRHVWTIFRGNGGVGAVNVRFLWSPWSTGKKAASMYPGDHYVDYVGFTGLNWANQQHPWNSMLNLYRKPITELGQIAPGKPVIVAEAGTVDRNANGASLKPAWIETGYSQVYDAFPSLAAIVYFNITVPHQADWRLTTPEHALDAYRSVADDARFQGKLTWAVPLPPVAHRPAASLVAKGKAKAPRVKISWRAATSGYDIAYYSLRLRTDGSWSTVSDHLAPSTSKLLKVRPDHTYVGRLRATNVRGYASQWVAGRAFSVERTDQTAPAVHYSSGFTNASLAGASGGSVAWSAHKGSKTVFTFTGQSIAFVSTRGPDRGKAKISIDGSGVGTVKLDSSKFKAGQVVFATALSPGQHTISVKVAKDGSAGAKRVDIDAFLVMP